MKQTSTVQYTVAHGSEHGFSKFCLGFPWDSLTRFQPPV